MIGHTKANRHLLEGLPKSHSRGSLRSARASPGWKQFIQNFAKFRKKLVSNG